MATTSRPSYVAAIYLVACCTIAFAAEPPAKDDKSKPPTAKPPIIESITQETAASPAAAEEIKKLVGSWYVVEHVQENEQAGAKILKLVVTPKTFFFADTGSSYPLWFHYRLDGSQSPKRLDLQVATSLDHEWLDSREAHPSIYALDGDELRISNGERDDSGKIRLRVEMLKVEPGVKRELLTMRRCSDIAALPQKTAKEVDAEILKSLDAGIALLEAKKYQEFFDSAAARQDPFRTIEYWIPELDHELLPTLRAAKRLVPTTSDGGSQAVYDFTKYHIAGSETAFFIKLQLVRKDKMWKLEGL
jgi:uncharacterized protein (TIGR03067 family)